MDDPLVKHALQIEAITRLKALGLDINDSWQAVLDLALALRAERSRRCATCVHWLRNGDSSRWGYCKRENGKSPLDTWFCADFVPEEPTP